MADITDVYVRIKYKKNGKIYEDDLLEDIDMYDALSDMEYNGIYYEIDDKLIMRAYGRNYYALCFQNESELKDYLFEISKEKGIENIYYIYCEYSYIMEVIRYGIINIDIVNKKVTVNIEKEEKYIEIFEKIANYSQFEDILYKLNEITSKSYDYQKKPIIRLWEWRYALFVKKDYPVAENYFQEAKVFARMIDNRHLIEQLEKQWEHDLQDFFKNKH